jgi:hypothetical protein
MTKFSVTFNTTQKIEVQRADLEKVNKATKEYITKTSKIFEKIENAAGIGKIVIKREKASEDIKLKPDESSNTGDATRGNYFMTKDPLPVTPQTNIVTID